MRKAPEPLIAFSEEMQEKNLELKQFLRKHLYSHYRVLRMTAKATRVLHELFDVFMADVRLLPPETRQDMTQMEADHGLSGRARAVADYIAGMTDRYAIAEHERLLNPRQLT